jgi:D-hydroxyproline dehydrogenase subunit gamma
MPSLSLTVNGVTVDVEPGTTVATAAMLAGQPCRVSISGAPRGPLCGMGICFECRMTINGRAHCRTCQIRCEPGMDVKSDD